MNTGRLNVHDFMVQTTFQANINKKFVHAYTAYLHKSLENCHS